MSEAAFSVSMAWAMVESTSVLATSHLFKVVDFNCLIFIYFFFVLYYYIYRENRIWEFERRATKVSQRGPMIEVLKMLM